MQTSWQTVSNITVLHFMFDSLKERLLRLKKKVASTTAPCKQYGKTMCAHWLHHLKPMILSHRACFSVCLL